MATLRAWFPAGDNWGQEFVYPKGLAAKIARETGERVLVAKAETVVELETAPVAEVTKTGEEEVFVPEPAPPEPAVETALEPVAEENAPEPEPLPLPPTASPFFTIGLLGAMFAAAGWALRVGIKKGGKA